MISIHKIVMEMEKTNEFITEMITESELSSGLGKETPRKILMDALEKVESTIGLIQTSLNPSDSKNFSFKASSKELLFSIEQLGQAWVKLYS